jgi:hypothetical protein
MNTTSKSTLLTIQEIERLTAQLKQENKDLSRSLKYLKAHLNGGKK